jgi:hypothetical protein
MTSSACAAPPGRFSEVACELLARGHAIRFRAPGSSMAPAILDGETITVEPVRPPEVRMDDIVLYSAEGRMIAHRVVGIVAQASAFAGAAPAFIVRGDSAGGTEVVALDKVLGRVLSVERQGRSVDLTKRRARMRFLLGDYAFGLKRRARGVFPEGIRRCARLFSAGSSSWGAGRKAR